MGRDLCLEKEGWCYRETVTEGSYRVSVYFDTLEEAIAPLQGRYPPNLIETLKEHKHVPSMILGDRGVFPCGLQIDKILDEAGLIFDGDDPLSEE